MREHGIIQSFRGVHNSTLIALDGTWYHSSKKIHCPCCSHLEHANGEITYYHSAVTPVNQVPLTEGEGALKVNWCELSVTDPAGTVLYHNAWITDWPITAQNVAALAASGRARWKIENENNNTLKTKGYHLEHNFGHGQQHLSSLLATLNILAFLFHTVLAFTDERYRLIRATLPTRQTFFQDVRALTRYLCFPGWDGLLRFMMRGLEIGPYAKPP